MAAKLSKTAHMPGVLLSPVCGLAGVGVGAAEAAGADSAPAKSLIEQGVAVYETTHCSSYIMTDVAQISGAAGETAGPSAASPQTGDAQASIMLWVAVAVLALAGAGRAALAKRR